MVCAWVGWSSRLLKSSASVMKRNFFIFLLQIKNERLNNHTLCNRSWVVHLSSLFSSRQQEISVLEKFASPAQVQA